MLVPPFYPHLSRGTRKFSHPILARDVMEREKMPNRKMGRTGLTASLAWKQRLAASYNELERKLVAMRVEPVSPEAEENEQADLEMQDEPYEGDTETDQEDEALNDSVVRRPEAASLRTGITAGREGKLTLGALTFAVVDGALIETAASDQTAEARCAHDGQPNPRTAAPSTAAPSAHAPFNEAPMDISSIYGSLFSPTAELDVQSKDLLDENWFSDDEPLVNIRTGSLWEDTFAQSNYYAEPEADGIYLLYLSADSDFPMDGFGSESATEDVDTATSTRKRKRSTPTMDTKRKHAKHRQTLSPRPREKRNRESAAEKQGQLASL